MCEEYCLAILTSKYQEIGCSLSFNSLAKICEDLRTKESSGDVLWFNIAVNQTATQSFADPPIITQKPSAQASPPLHSTPETLSVCGRDIIAALANECDSRRTKKSCSMQPHLSGWTLNFNRQTHRDATEMYEKEIESVDLR